MITTLTTEPAVAAEFIRNTGTCAFPTETVYGLGASVFNEAAVAEIYEAKRRPSDNPLIAHIWDRDQIAQLSSNVTPTAQKLIDAFFPGPLTVVLSKTANVPLIATAGLETIGIRMPGFAAANKFLEFCGVPVVAPSANLSGRPSPTTWEAVYEDLNGRIDCILQGEPTEIGLESTVVDCTDSSPILLRKGSISIEQLRQIVPEIVLHEPTTSEPTRSPGLKHKHYSPRAAVKILTPGSACEGEGPIAFIGLRDPGRDLALKKICSSVEEYAHWLFAFFRECDASGIRAIYCEAVDDHRIGSALDGQAEEGRGELII